MGQARLPQLPRERLTITLDRFSLEAGRSGLGPGQPHPPSTSDPALLGSGPHPQAVCQLQSNVSQTFTRSPEPSNSFAITCRLQFELLAGGPIGLAQLTLNRHSSPTSPMLGSRSPLPAHCPPHSSLTPPGLLAPEGPPIYPEHSPQSQTSAWLAASTTETSSQMSPAQGTAGQSHPATRFVPFTLLVTL